jgi:hypothetical protein
MKLRRDAVPQDEAPETKDVPQEGSGIPPSGLPIGVEHQSGEVPLCGNEPLP